MKTFIKNTPLLLTTLGLLIMAQSIFWEYVRVRPDYRFVITPWSQRGYEINQGLVIAAGAIVILTVVLLLWRGIIKEKVTHSAIAIGIIVGFGVVAAMLTDAKDIDMAFPVQVALAAILGVVVRSLLEGYIPEAWNKRRRATRFGLWFGGSILGMVAFIGPLLNGEKPFWVFVAIAGVTMGLLSLFRPPTQLAGSRMIINGILAIWVMSMAMSASLRVGLEEAQFALNGVSADAQNLQITSGVLLAWLGGLLAFSGAVGLWAKRRDEIAAVERAHKQQAAARESEAQLSVTG